jgi:hypothetical protein
MMIAIIGLGNVGKALAGALAREGRAVIVGARDPGSEKTKETGRSIPSARITTVKEAAREAEIIFLATPYVANQAVLAGAGDLSGKIIVDCTNPVGPGVSHGLDSRTSGGEETQRLAPSAKVVKAFSIYGWENFGDSRYPAYKEVIPAMLMAGNDSSAKEIVGKLIASLGFEPVDTGGISMSLHLEHMALLWIKMARLRGKGSGFAWGLMRR